MLEDDASRMSEGDDASQFRFDRRTVKLLVPIIVAVFLVNLNVSITAPFFPEHAKSKYGASDITIGGIFAVYPFAIMLASPGMGFLCNYNGTTVVLNSGLLVASCGSFIFGVAGSIWLYYAARVIQGIGAAAVIVAATASNAANFPKHIGTTMGLQEAATGIGFMLGPPIGKMVWPNVPSMSPLQHTHMHARMPARMHTQAHTRTLI